MINDGGNSAINLNFTDLLNLNEAQTAVDTLVIHGNADDTVNLGNASNGQAGDWVNTGSGVYAFTTGEIGIIGTETIDTGVMVHILAKGIAAWLLCGGAEVKAQLIGMPPSAASICSLSPVQLVLYPLLFLLVPISHA